MNQKNTYDKGSEWYNVDQIYDYNGPIDTSVSSTSDEIRTWNGLTGPLHTANGFRLRSYTYPKASFKKISLTKHHKRICKITVYAINKEK